MLKLISVFLLIVLMATGFGCSGKKVVLPEISDKLEAVPAELNIEDSLFLHMWSTNRKIIVADKKGKIIRWDPEKKETDMHFQFKDSIRETVFQEKDLVLLATGQNRMSVFDLSEIKEIADLPLIPGARFTAMNRRLLLYLLEGKLYVHDFRKNKILAEFPHSAEKFRGAQIFFDSILLLSRDHLTVINPENFRAETIPLINPAATAFLRYDRNIYYGSENSKLVKLSLPKKKVAWSVELPRTLKLPPVRAGRFIAVTPEDNIMYFYTSRGGLHWWSALQSTRLFPPTAMQQNMAVVLYPANSTEVKFFNFRKKTVQSLKQGKIIRHMPVFCSGALYFYFRGTKKDPAGIYRISNRRDVETVIEPEFPRITRRALTFRLNPVNLIKPDLTVKISDNSGTIMLEKKFTPLQDLNFAWIPDRDGEYSLDIAVRQKDQADLSVKSHFTVIDLKSLCRKYYFDTLTICPPRTVPEREPAK